MEPATAIVLVSGALALGAALGRRNKLEASPKVI